MNHDDLVCETTRATAMIPLNLGKTFRYPKGHPSLITPTVADMIAYLKQWPDDMPLIAEWEAQYKAICDPRVGEFQDGLGTCQVLIFDVERNT